MKLAQNQVWKKGEEYIRIVHLERLAVKYKALKKLLTGEGAHHQVSKKEFCRLLKGATLLTQNEVRDIWHAEGLETAPPDSFEQAGAARSADDDQPVTGKRSIQP